MNEIEPQLTSMPQSPSHNQELSMSEQMPMLPEHGTPSSSGPSGPSGFDKTKLLIPGAIILAGLIVSGSILYGRLGAGQALVAGDQAPAAQQAGLPAGQAGKVDVNIANAPVLGNADAPVTVVEFGDFQCPFCERYFKNNEPAMISEYVDTGKVKFVWKDYAFLGQESTWSAQAARCAGDQGKFWQYHNYLYNHQGSENSGAFSTANLKKFAVAVGLNTGNFNTCLDSGKYASAVSDSTKYGSSIGVSGTPATFVNGTLIVGAVPYANIKSVIESALK